MTRLRPSAENVNCLVTGAGGLLGNVVVELANRRGWTVRTLHRDRLDMANIAATADAILGDAPDVLINCAAHTNVEKAESDIDESYTVNAVLPGILADVCRKSNALLVHMSSTGCYGDWKTEPYTDFEPLKPTTVHHSSKAAGEEQIAHRGCRALILRTGWLYGDAVSEKRNFALQRIKEAAGKKELYSDPSQRGNPTLASDVARQLIHLVENDVSGTFNCTAHGAGSRFEYVSRIIEASGMDCRVMPAPPGMFTRRAPVSPNEAGVNYQLRLMGLDIMPDWEEAVRGYVEARMPAFRTMLTSPAN